jgi:hypothetical protein
MPSTTSTVTPPTKHQQIIEDRYIDRQRLEDYLKISFPKAEVKTQVSSSAQPSLIDVFKSSHNAVETKPLDHHRCPKGPGAGMYSDQPLHEHHMLTWK